MKLKEINNRQRKLLLVGDNPFHGISHLSQERARARGKAITSPEHAAKLVMLSLENGADGFMFSVSKTTLSILRIISQINQGKHFKLYAIIPYAYEFVRKVAQIGTVGLIKHFTKQVARSGNIKAITMGLKGIFTTNPGDLLKAYLAYEIDRMKSSISEYSDLESIMVHEVVTDMALAFDLDWLFKLFIDYMLKLGIKPGFQTRNFAYLVNKLKQWDVNLHEIVIAAPFNKVGFQMNPSKEECEKTLVSLPEANVIAISVLAAGYLKPEEAIDYIASLPNIRGVAIGVSKELHAHETFKLFRKVLDK